jgi:hypothetical protein
MLPCRLSQKGSHRIVASNAMRFTSKAEQAYRKGKIRMKPAGMAVDAGPIGNQEASGNSTFNHERISCHSLLVSHADLLNE